MNEALNNLYNLIIDIVNTSNIYGLILACLLIFCESILPVMPLFVFITIIFIAFGSFFGFLISYFLTSLGCLFAFFLCRKWRRRIIDKFQSIREVSKIIKIVDKMSLSNLTTLMSFPFTPAFLVNIAVSLSTVPFQKYLIAISISKIFLVFFWGFIGTSLLESLKNPQTIVIIVVMLLIAYFVSKIIINKFNIK